MILQELMDYMETIAPTALAEEWDNVGLLVGDAAKPIKTVVVALDADREAIAFAKRENADVIVSHHPLIFSPVRAVTAPSALYDLAASGMALYAAHTNLDAAQGGVNDALATTLGLLAVEPFAGLGRVGELPAAMDAAAFAAHVNKALGTRVQMKAADRPIKTVAVVGGSGGDFISDVMADAYVTGEMKHHEWLAVPPHMTVIVGGHYHTEAVIVEPLCERLQTAFPTLRVIAYRGCAPYETV